MSTLHSFVQANAFASKQKNKSLFTQVKTSVFSCLLLIVCTCASHAQCVAPSMSFHSPVLLSGTDLQPGAVYLFPQVIPGVDANIKIVDFVGGAQIYNIDDSAGIGYYDAFQPYVVAPADSVSYVDWEIRFVSSATSLDTNLACFAVTAIDVDGNGLDLQEFVSAATPGSFAVDPATLLTVTFDGVASTATSQIYNVPNIDTAHLEAMFQMNFQNISTLKYRNGAISTYSADMVRQTCIYFKSFFNTFTLLLPVRLISFTARNEKNATFINWQATNENDLSYYIVQKSSDGNNWSDLQTVMVGNDVTNNYFITDAQKTTAVVYYRLKEINKNGQAVYSNTIKLNNGAITTADITCNNLIQQTVNMQINAATADNYTVDVFAVNGAKIKEQQVAIAAGYNPATVTMPASASNGLYILTVKNSRGEIIYHSKIVKN